MVFRIKGKSDINAKELVFDLAKLEDGGIEMVVIDDDGEQWAVLKIKPNGKLYLYPGIESGIGLTLDKDGEIRLSSDEC